MTQASNRAPAAVPPLHHPGEAVLMDYAAGALSEAVGLIVATHLALCPACRAEVARLEAVGGALLEGMPDGEPDMDLLEGVLARLDAPAPAAPRRPAPHPASAVLPEPLRSYLGGDVGRIGWRRVMRGLEEALVDCGRDKVRLMRIRAGTAMPRHTHAGNEYTLVLAGGFSDALGHYLRGDFIATDAAIDHRPVADDGPDCLCLAVTDAPLRLTGPVGRLLNPFVQF
ncbi:MAG TPA: ChrR family anti-sigma-E factor [Azospirillaceae bacterium]|nr:ChrR family anti-sigma-E factor [Azospirillaceae bacterium]